MMIKNIIQGQQVDPIGLISDLFDAIQYLNEPQNLSDNLLQVYNPYTPLTSAVCPEIRVCGQEWEGDFLCRLFFFCQK